MQLYTAAGPAIPDSWPKKRLKYLEKGKAESAFTLEKYRPDRLREQPHSGSGKPKYCMRGFGPTKEMQTAVYSVYLKSWGDG